MDEDIRWDRCGMKEETFKQYACQSSLSDLLMIMLVFIGVFCMLECADNVKYCMLDGAIYLNNCTFYCAIYSFFVHLRYIQVYIVWKTYL